MTSNIPALSSLPSKGLAYLVLPPGHGKTVRHSPAFGLYEADQVVNCRGTPELSRRRDEARTTGHWAMYDALWGYLLYVSTPSHSVVMVPTTGVGVAMGATFLGAAYLPMEQWECNLLARAGSPDKYMGCYQDAQQVGVVMNTNEKLTTYVLERLTLWRRGSTLLWELLPETRAPGGPQPHSSTRGL